MMDWLKKREGKRVTLTLNEKKPARSTQQNNYYWGVYLPLIQRETDDSYTVDGLHTLFKGLFLGGEIVDILGKKVRLSKSTSSLNKSEFTEYIMAIAEFTGVMPPETDTELAIMHHD
jgi:hypothetical protein